MESGERSLEFWLEDLERRRTYVRPEHTMRGFFYKGLLDSLRTLGDEALVRHCLEACGQERFVDFFSYSVELLFPVFRAALPVLTERYGSTEAALRRLGEQSSIDFLASVPGKAMLLLVGGRPHPMINSLPAAFRMALSFGEATLEWKGPRHGRMRVMTSFMPPPFHEGCVGWMLQAARAQDIQVSARPEGALGIECEFSWT